MIAGMLTFAGVRLVYADSTGAVFIQESLADELQLGLADPAPLDFTFPGYQHELATRTTQHAIAVRCPVIEEAPEFSEGWNRRATVRFYQRDYDGSLDDIEQTLKLEPRHFGAVWGLGMILGTQHDFERAISAFERLLEIKPNAADARPRIELLKQELAKQSV